MFRLFLPIVFCLASLILANQPWMPQGLPPLHYAFGGSTQGKMVTEKGSSYFEYRGDPSAYSGFFVGVPGGKNLDWSGRDTLELAFRARALRKDEVVSVGFEDSVSGRPRRFTGQALVLDTCWQTFHFPLRTFSSLGAGWNNVSHKGESGPMDWSHICGLHINSDQNLGRAQPVVVQFQDILISSLPVGQRQATSVPASLPQLTPASQLRLSFFDGSLPPGGWHYIYGGNTQADLLPTRQNSRALLRLSMDNRDYSGGALKLPANHDISATLRKLALCFWVRGNAADLKAYVGLLDDESDGPNRSVETRVRLQDYAKTDTVWQRVVIPLFDFPDMGVWWNPESHSGITAKMDWSHLDGVRFSVDRTANPSLPEEQVVLEFAQISLIDLPAGTFDAQAYWDKFQGSSLDTIVEDFGNGKRNSAWLRVMAPTSRLSLSFPVDAGRAFLRMEYDVQPWANAILDLDSVHLRNDFSAWRGIRASVNGHKRFGRIGIRLVDSTNESWIASAEVGDDWRDVVFRFCDFTLEKYWQPENAQPNRRLDLGHIHSIALYSMDYNQQGTLDVGSLVLTNQKDVSEHDSHNAAVRYSQIGYLPWATKIALVTNDSDETFLLLDSTGRKAYEGPLIPNGDWAPSGDSVRLADFSKVLKPGLYRLWVNDSVQSAPFRIDAAWPKFQLRDALKSYFFQRSGMALSPKFVGKYARPIAHRDTALLFHPSMNRTGTWDAHGGWYDAGDYGKYVVNGGISVATLMLAAELYPQATAFDDLGIPESHNHRPDLLDEVRYELEWFLRMQDQDGGVFFKVAANNWDGFMMPNQTTNPRNVIGKSTTSTLNFAAALAQAHHVFAKTDKKFAERCLRQAKRAYQWAQGHPDVPFPNHGEGSGLYDDSDFRDEFLWAEAALWRETGDTTLLARLRNRLDQIPAQTAASWQSTGNLGWILLARQNRDTTLRDRARKQLDAQTKIIQKAVLESAFRVPLETFYWGSNGAYLNQAMTAAVTGTWNHDPTILATVAEITDYIYGRNALGVSFVTGSSATAPRFPHHRIMGGDTVEAPFPGFLVGGVNSNREDDIKQDSWGVRYPHGEPGLAYYDHQEAFASNETCINWNAPLVLVLAALANGKN
ncbi:MAG TPA: glycoside hydrolase family 9 protein [Fibrobacteraceae bacterium]|nr:glycoside hydrolase family 9 protein [Fibrobacteraceae bacterium]